MDANGGTEGHPLREKVKGKLVRIIKAEQATAEKAEDILRAANSSRDKAEAILGIVERPNYQGDMEGFGGTIDPWVIRAEEQAAAISGLAGPSSDAFADIAASSFSGTTAKVQVWPVTFEDLAAVARFEETVNRPELVPLVENAMRRLGLDQGFPGNESPLALLRQAHSLYEARTDSTLPVPSIMALRSCLLEMFGLLLLWRPRKEQAGKEAEKIRSLGRLLALDNLPEGTIDSWVESWDEVGGMGSLDTKKAAMLSVHGWRRVLFEYTAWLRGFLSGLDPGKLRK